MTVARHGDSDLKGRVLLVDDDELIRQSYTRVLTKRGFVVQTADSGENAIELLGRASFDVLVSDVKMEGMTGTEFLRAVRGRDLDVPVILMTGVPGVETAIEAVEYRAFRYLRKPVDFEVLMQAVRSAIHTHVMARVLADHVPLPEACRRIVRATCQTLDWDFASIWMPAAGAIACVETWARPGYDSAAFEQATKTSVLEAGQGLPGRVWREAAPEWIPAISRESNFPRASAAVTTGFRSGFAVPFSAEGEVFAVLEFFSRSGHEPDLVLLELFATSSAQLGAQVLRERADQRAFRAESSERSLAATLNAIMECAPAFILTINREGQIQFLNKVLPHHRMEDVIGSDWLLYMPPTYHHRLREYLRCLLDTGAPVTYETEVVGPDGGALWMNTHMGPLRDGDKVVGAVLVAQDVTALRRSQIDAAAAQKWASVGTMAAGIAHEVNTPVQFVNDSVHFLRDASRDLFGLVEKLQNVRSAAAESGPRSSLDEAVALSLEAEEEADLAYLQNNVPSAFERCLGGLDRIRTIVQSMKDFSHPAQQDMVPADLNRALKSTITIARSEFKYVANLEVEPGDLPLVTCQINEINQVFLNLIVNAAHAIADVVKGTDQKGTIKVRTWREGEHVLISVSDTGAGIPKAISARIFEPFFTTKEVGKGTGQGLALAWVVVKEKHGGDLTFESREGLGTTFLVRLPIARTFRPPPPPPAPL